MPLQQVVVVLAALVARNFSPMMSLSCPSRKLLPPLPGNCTASLSFSHSLARHANGHHVTSETNLKTNYCSPHSPISSSATIMKLKPTGLFAISGKTGELFDVSPPVRHQQDPAVTLNIKQYDSIRLRLGELLTQWPINIEFRALPSAHLATGGVSSPQQPMRQCQSLSGDTTFSTADDGQTTNSVANLANRCHLSKYNATNFVCSCDAFGFVVLTQQFGLNTGFQSIQNDHIQWPASTINDLSLGGIGGNQLLGDHQSIDSRVYDPAYMVNRSQQQQQQQQSLGIVTYVFVIIGVALLTLSVAGMVINVTLRLTGQSRLSKKQQSLFESLRNGPTTGPIAADHNLMGSDPLVSGAATTHSASIIGLASGVAGSNGGGPMGQMCAAGSTATNGSSNYKTHQQLYSAHMGAHSPPMMEAYSSPSSRRWPVRLVGWLLERPASWLSYLTSSNSSDSNKADRMIQHRIIGSNASTIGTLAYQKGQ